MKFKILSFAISCILFKFKMKKTPKFNSFIEIKLLIKILKIVKNPDINLKIKLH